MSPQAYGMGINGKGRHDLLSYQKTFLDPHNNKERE